jgi:heme exporter protein B
MSYLDRAVADVRNDAQKLKGYFRHVLCHLRKDLKLEWRSRESVVGMLFFALLVVIIFSLAFDPTAAVSRQIAGGILWVALLFASFTALNQSWTREQRNRVLDAQRMAPAPPSALFLGKAIANMLFVALVELVLAPLFIVFYNLHALGQGWLLALVMPLGTWALVCNGTFFAAMGLRTRNRELLLPLILVPISLPALLGMMQATSAILTGETEPGIWIRLLIAYNIAFTTACLLLFDTVLSAE